MISVKVRTILTIKKILGKGEIEVPVPENTTLKELITILGNRFGDELTSLLAGPENRNRLPHIRYMVNGRDIAFLNGMETALESGDEVLILPPVSGG
jgi:molybdopterin synthase sulfur carrier subunit